MLYDLIQSFSSLLCCLLLLAIPGFIIVSIVRRSNKNNTNSVVNTKIAKDGKIANFDKNQVILEWLLQQKQNGLQTIDQLIAILKIGNNQNTNTEIKPQTINHYGQLVNNYQNGNDQLISNPTPQIPPPMDTTQIPKPKISKPLIRLTNAEILLYLGSALVVFSVFIFVAFTWEMFTNPLKIGLLLCFNILFYALGGFLYKNKTFRQAGSTFITIASLTLGFSGIGFWNFGLKEDLGVNFSYYWVVYSIFLSSIYFLTLYLLNLKRFFYFFVIAFYSLIISFSFALTNDYKFRIVIIAVLNLLIYLSEGIFANFSQIIKNISRSLNLVFDILIFFSVVLYYDQINTSFLRFVSLAALAVPTVFIISSYIKENTKQEVLYSIFSLPFKFFLIYGIFKFSYETEILLFLIYAFVLTLLSEKEFLNKSIKLFQASYIVNAIITSVSTLIVLIQWIPEERKYISDPFAIGVLILNIILIFIPLVIRRNYKLISYADIYITFTVLRIFTLLFPGLEIIAYLLFILGIHYVLVFMYLYYKDKNNFSAAYLFNPSLYFTSLIILFVSVKGSMNQILLGYGLLSVSYMLIEYLFKNKYLRTLSIILNYFSYWALLNILFSGLLINYHFNLNDTGLLMLIPGLIYTGLAEFDLLKENGKSYYYAGTMIFYLTACLLTITTPIYFSVVVFFLFIHAYYFLKKYKNDLFSLSFFALSHLLVLYIFLSLDISLTKSFLVIALLNIFYSITTTDKIKILGSNLNEVVLSNFREYSNITNIVLLFFVLINLFTNANYYIVGSSLICALNAILINKNSNLKHISGFGIVFALWTLCSIFSLNGDYYFLSLTAYLFLFAFYNLYKKRDNKWGMLFFSSSYGLLLSLVLVFNFSLVHSVLLFSVLTFIYSLICSKDNIFNSDMLNYVVRNAFRLLATCVSYGILIFVFLSMFELHSYLFSIAALIAAASILIANNDKTAVYLSGIGPVIAVWNIAFLSHANFQIYVIPVTLYLLFLSFVYKKENKYTLSLNLEQMAYSWQFLTLLYQSIFSSEGQKILYGMILILACIIVLVRGMSKNEKSIISLAVIFIFLELLIRLYVVIITIPWWIYVGLIGLGLISAAIYIIGKVSKNDNKTSI